MASQGQRVSIVGILNVTPDSYFDGGRYVSPEAAVARAEEMLHEGASVIEVGGESTGPGSFDVSENEEIQRVIPAIAAIRAQFPDARIAVDTYKSSVARAAVQAGATIVNDVSAGRADVQMFPVVAATEATIVLMYAKDPTPRTTVAARTYVDVIAVTKEFLRSRRDNAHAAGIASSKIILDPGLGHFVSSEPYYSFEILRRLEELRELECPLLLSPSRKSFLAGRENLPTRDRLPGTLVASAIAVLHGASYIRTHDVLAVARACEIAEQIHMTRK